jgi:RNA polymerase primary sigma factor
MSKTLQMINEVSTFDPLSLESQCELVEMARNGDEEAKIILFGSLKGLIVKNILKPYGVPFDSWDDAMSSCYIGFENALKRYNSEHGAKFSTYAFYWLRLELVLWLKEQSVIRLPSKIGGLVKKLQEYLLAIPGNDQWPWKVTVEGVQGFCKKMGCTESMAKNIINSYRLLNPEAYSSGNDGAFNGSQVEYGAFELIKAEVLKVAMKKALTTRERDVLELRFGLNGERPQEQPEIGLELGGISKQSVSATEQRGLRKLKEFLLANHPEFCHAT